MIQFEFPFPGSLTSTFLAALVEAPYVSSTIASAACDVKRISHGPPHLWQTARLPPLPQQLFVLHVRARHLFSLSLSPSRRLVHDRVSSLPTGERKSSLLTNYWSKSMMIRWTGLAP